MDHVHDLSEEIQAKAKAMRTLVPDVFSGYTRMAQAATAEGALATKHKELVALAIAATRECDGCIGAHARGAARAGATSQEVAEAMAVVIMMNGGPGTVWGPRALAAFEEAREDARD